MYLKGIIIHGVVRYERMKSWAKFTQNAILLYCPFLFIENLTFPSSISFPINLEGSTRTALVFVIFALQQKTSIKKKKIQPYAKSLLSNNTPNRFKLIMTINSGKTCGLRRRNKTITLSSAKSRTVDNMPL